MNIMKGCRHWEIFLRNSNGGNRHNKWGLESRPRSCWPSSSPPSPPPPPSHATFGSKPAQPDSLVMKWSKTWKRMWKWNHEAARAKAVVLVNLRQVAKKNFKEQVIFSSWLHQAWCTAGLEIEATAALCAINHRNFINVMNPRHHFHHNHHFFFSYSMNIRIAGLTCFWHFYFKLRLVSNTVC